MREMKILLVLFICFSMLVCSNSNVDENITKELIDGVIVNYKPQYPEGEYISLTKLHDIRMIETEYEIPNISGIVADEDNNIYILNIADRNISVFDDNGIYVRTMGREGQGPNELPAAMGIKYYKNNLYITSTPNEIKIWDLNGNYVDRFKFLTRNISGFYTGENNVYVITSRRQQISNIDNYIVRKYSLDISSFEDIITYESNPKIDYSFYFPYSISMSKDENIYVPESPFVYSIQKFDQNGELMLKFGRTYEYRDLSDDELDHYRERYRNFIADGYFSNNPDKARVIRRIMNDAYNNIWVLSGEIYEDTGKYYQDTFDVFDQEGTWLQSVQLPKENLPNSFFRYTIQNNRLYTYTIPDPVDVQQYVRVYEIHYRN